MAINPITGVDDSSSADTAKAFSGGTATPSTTPSAPAGTQTPTTTPTTTPAPVSGAPATTPAPTSVATPATPATAPAASPTGGIINNASPDVANWYRSVYGRDPDQGGLDYWNKQLANGGNVNDVFQQFTNGGTTNGEHFAHTGLTAGQAGTYTGPMSSDSSTVVDDWARNVLGSTSKVSAADSARYNDAFNKASASGDIAGAKNVYAQFLKDYSGQVQNPNMSYSDAAQLTSTPQPKLDASGAPIPVPVAPALAQYNATTAAINPTTDTVQGQVNTMMQQGNPLLDRAEQLSEQKSNERGLVNSSIAAQAGQTAMLDAALQIATPDAAAYNQQRLTNQGYTNDASKFNTSESNTVSKMGYQNDLTQSNMVLGNALDTQKLREQNALDTQKIKLQGQIDISKIDAQSQATLNLQLKTIKANADTSHDATSYNASLNAASAFTSEVNRINADDKISADAKPGMVAAAEQNFHRQLDYYTALGSTDHGALLTPSGGAAAAAPAAAPGLINQNLSGNPDLS